MIVTDLLELKLHSVINRGIPNQERVAIYIEENTNMGQYGVMIGHASVNNTALPYQDNLFWFGDGGVNKGDWIFLYTGKGTPKTDVLETGTGNIYSVHWGRESTIFANSSIIPILFRLDAVDVGIPPENLPQLGLENA